MYIIYIYICIYILILGIYIYIYIGIFNFFSEITRSNLIDEKRQK